VATATTGRTPAASEPPRTRTVAQLDDSIGSRPPSLAATATQRPAGGRGSAVSGRARLEFEVAEASDGQQCLDAVGMTRPDVVVLDLKMPVLDGVAAAERIEQQWPEIRVVMLTSSDRSDDRARAMRYGVEAFAQKTSIAEGQLVPPIAAELADPMAT
jgi:CheY-like chemotaxis protein